MTTWLFIVLSTAVGGALIVWHNVSETKQIAEDMLDKYRDMLTDARKKRAEALAKQDEENPES